MIMVGAMRSVNVAVVVGLGLALAGCRVGPQYARPSAPLAPAFKEELPSNFKSQDGWKPAQPSDALLKGDWWTLFNDSQLNALEAQIDPANQTLKESEANFRSARAFVKFNRASEAPTISTAPGLGAVRDSRNQPYISPTIINSGEGDFILPFDFDYEIDLWGRIRRTVAQASEKPRPPLPISNSRGSPSIQSWLLTISTCVPPTPRSSSSMTPSRLSRMLSNSPKTAITAVLLRSLT